MLYLAAAENLYDGDDATYELGAPSTSYTSQKDEVRVR